MIYRNGYIGGYYDGDRYKFALQGRIQDFKLGGGALKKIAPSGGRGEIFWGLSFEYELTSMHGIYIYIQVVCFINLRLGTENFHDSRKHTSV
jgi:hypothetical protein